MHRTTGRWKLGFLLALCTALLWGMLPIALKLLLGAMDVYSITWYRFLAAALILGAFVVRRAGLPGPRQLGGAGWWLLLIAALGLTGNYLFYLLGLDYISPGAAQVVIQLAPMLLLLGGLVIFGERLARGQLLGLALLLTGMALFFNHRLAEIFGSFGDYTLGIVLIVVASVTWAGYALAQKQLLNQLASEQIMLIIYLAGALVFLPSASPETLFALDGFSLFLLAFASLNTLFAYGAFAEALDHWEASRVSAVLSVTPLLTLLFSFLLGLVTPRVAAEPLNLLSVCGALLVVAGSMFTALGGRRREPALAGVAAPD